MTTYIYIDGASIVNLLQSYGALRSRYGELILQSPAGNQIIRTAVEKASIILRSLADFYGADKIVITDQIKIEVTKAIDTYANDAAASQLLKDPIFEIVSTGVPDQVVNKEISPKDAGEYSMEIGLSAM